MNELIFDKQIQELIAEAEEAKKKTLDPYIVRRYDHYIEAYKNVFEKTYPYVKKLLRRDTPKKPFSISMTKKGRIGRCPGCGKVIDEKNHQFFHNDKDCLQKIDWEMVILRNKYCHHCDDIVLARYTKVDKEYKIFDTTRKVKITICTCTMCGNEIPDKGLSEANEKIILEDAENYAKNREVIKI